MRISYIVNAYKFIRDKMKRLGLIFIFLLFFSLFSSSILRVDAYAQPEPELKLHMNEIEGSTAYDSSENGYDGTTYNTEWVSGVFNNALYFDGSSNLDAKILTSVETWEDLLKWQGVCSDGTYIYTTDGTILRKYDLDENLLASVSSGYHSGDICYHDGYIYVTYHEGDFKQEGDPSIIRIYNSTDLTFDSNSTEIYTGTGAGSITYNSDDGHFYIAEGSWYSKAYGFVYEYDEDFLFIDNYTVATGWAIMPFQGISYEADSNMYIFTDHQTGCWLTNSTFDILFKVQNPLSTSSQGVDWINSTNIYFLSNVPNVLYNARIDELGVTGSDCQVPIVHDFFSGVTEYTVTGWFKWDGGGGGSDGRKFIFETYPTYWASDLFITLSGLIGASYYFEDLTQGSEYSTLTVSEDMYYFFVLSWEVGHITVLLNGITYIDEVIPEKMLVATTGIILGTYRIANNRWFDGIIDEFRIYDESLSDQELDNLYNMKTVTVQNGTYGTASPTGTFDEPEYYDLGITATPVNASYLFNYWQIVDSSRLGQNPYTLTFTKDMTVYPVFKHVSGDTINPLLSFILPMVILIGATGFAIILAKRRR